MLNTGTQFIRGLRTSFGDYHNSPITLSFNKINAAISIFQSINSQSMNAQSAATRSAHPSNFYQSRKFCDALKALHRIPQPTFAQNLKYPHISTRIDLTNLPKPSGYGDHGLQLVAFDSSGTLTGCGVLSPAEAYVKLFEKFGVPITMKEAYHPMGKHKFVHLMEIFSLDIEKISGLAPVRERWKQKYGKYPTEKDGKEMFKHFVPIQFSTLNQREIPITGAKELLHNVKQMGWKTTSTTGFITGMDIFNQLTRDSKISIDYPCDAEQVPYGRPRGDMVLLGLARANTAPSYCVKVGDTQGDDAEGLNANVWTVGLTVTSSYVRTTEAELHNMRIDDIEKLRAIAFRKHAEMQPHFIVDGIWNLFPVLRMIDLMLRKGFHPFDFPVKPTEKDPEKLYKPALIPGHYQGDGGGAGGGGVGVGGVGVGAGGGGVSIGGL